MIELDTAIKQCAVVGAAGRMGCGIAALLLQEMSHLEAEQFGGTGIGMYQLLLIDQAAADFYALHCYLREQLTKYAQKHIELLKSYYVENTSLTSDEAVVEAFVEGGMTNVRLDSCLYAMAHSQLIFEAVVESIPGKVAILSFLRENTKTEPYFFSNTSAIPIHILDEKAGLQHRIVGMHFFNPPVVQPMVEIVIPKDCVPELPPLATALAQRLQKKVVYSQDIAGFISNGFFMRGIQYACQQHTLLVQQGTAFTEALFLLNKVTEEFLLRPMGIFHLIDYLGLDVCERIATVMTENLPGTNFHHPLIQKMLAQGIVGGQTADRMQKNGFFSYDKNCITGIFDPEKGTYLSCESFPWIQEAKNKLGAVPEGADREALMSAPDREERLKSYFQKLGQSDTWGAAMARDYLGETCRIAQLLVGTGVAASLQDVSTELIYGFGHLYGPNAANFPWMASSQNTGK